MDHLFTMVAQLNNHGLRKTIRQETMVCCLQCVIPSFFFHLLSNRVPLELETNSRTQTFMLTYHEMFFINKCQFLRPPTKLPQFVRKKLSVHFSLVKLTCFDFNVRKHINQEKSYKREQKSHSVF